MNGQPCGTPALLLLLLLLQRATATAAGQVSHVSRRAESREVSHLGAAGAGDEAPTNIRPTLFPSWHTYYDLFGDLARLYGPEWPRRPRERGGRSDLFEAETSQIVSPSGRSEATGWQGVLRAESVSREKKKKKRKKRRKKGEKKMVSDKAEATTQTPSLESHKLDHTSEKIHVDRKVGPENSNGTSKSSTRQGRRRRKRRKRRKSANGAKKIDNVVKNGSVATPAGTAPSLESGEAIGTVPTETRALIEDAESTLTATTITPLEDYPQVWAQLVKSASQEREATESPATLVAGDDGAEFGSYIVPERLRLHPDMTAEQMMDAVNRDFNDVVLEDKEEMAELAREDELESRALAAEDAEEDRAITMDANEEREVELPDTTDAPPDAAEYEERNRVSEHEDPPEPPTRPNYTHEGMWARPPPDLGIDFIPLQVLTQVRRYETVSHLSPEDALAEATTEEEYINAPRLREVVSHRKTSEVYSEEGYEDAGYDHGGYNKEGEHHEVIPAFEATAMMVKMPEAEGPEPEGQTREEYVLDPESEPSQQRVKKLRPDGTAAPDTPTTDRPRSRKRKGEQKTTKGSWSITQVIKDDDEKVVVLKEGGNITTPTTVRPMSPMGRYAEKHQNATLTQANKTEASSASPVIRSSPTVATSNSMPPTANSNTVNKNAPQSGQATKRPPPKRKKNKRKRKKVSKIPSQLLGFKYPAARKQVKSKGKKNSPLGKAKRKRKMQERAKKLSKLSKLRANEVTNRKKSRNNKLGPNGQDKSLATKDGVSGKGRLEKLKDGTKSSLNTIQPNHRYKETVDPSFFSYKLMEAIRKKEGADSFLQKFIPQKFLPANGVFPNGQDWTSLNTIDSEVNLKKPKLDFWNRPWGSYPNQPLTVGQGPTSLPPVFSTSSLKDMKAMGNTEMKAQTSKAVQVANLLQAAKTTATPVTLDERPTTVTNIPPTADWLSAPTQLPPASEPQILLGAKLPSLFFTAAHKPNVSDMGNLYENAFTPMQRRIDRLHDSLIQDIDSATLTSKQAYRSLIIGKRSIGAINNQINDETKRKFPKTEATQQLQSRIEAMLKLESSTLHSMPSTLKHVTPILNMTDKRNPHEGLSLEQIRQQMLKEKSKLQTKKDVTDTYPQSSITGFLRNSTSIQNHTVDKGAQRNIMIQQDKNRPIANFDKGQKDDKNERADSLPQEDKSNYRTSSTKGGGRLPSNGEHSESEPTTQPTTDVTKYDDSETDDDSNEDETTEMPEFDEEDPDWIHDATKSTTKLKPTYVIPNPPVNKRKYPFYAAPQSEALTSYTPLRYASNPFDVPIKTEGGMEFYESRDRAVHCEDPKKPDRVVPERGEDGEWNKNPQPDGPRMGTLGDVIGCMRRKLFGQDPLDNPFFQETSVGLPEETALVGAYVDAAVTPAPKLFDQFGFYKDILSNIQSASIGPSPDEVKHQPYIRVGAQAFDSDEAPSSPGNVRVAYTLPVNEGESDRKQESRPRASTQGNWNSNGKGKPQLQSLRSHSSADKMRLKLGQDLQQSEESEERESVSAEKEYKLSNQDGAQSKSIEYFVYPDGRPAEHPLGSRLEKSQERKQGLKDVMYHKIVRPVASDSVEFNINYDSKESPSTKDFNRPENGKLRIRHGNPSTSTKNLNVDKSKDSVQEIRQKYNKALENSRALTNARKEQRKNSMNLMPPISKSVLKSLESAEVPLEEFIKNPTTSKKKIQKQKSKSVNLLEDAQEKPKLLPKNHKSTPKRIQDLKDDLYDIESSESSDFIRPKANSTNGPIFFADSKKKGGSNEFHHVKSYQYSVPLKDEEYEGEDKDEEKPNSSAGGKPTEMAITAESQMSEETEPIRLKSIHLGIEDDSVIEIPVDTTHFSPYENSSKPTKKSKSLIKSASTEQQNSSAAKDTSYDEKENDESPEEQKETLKHDDSEENDSQKSRNEEVDESMLPQPVTFEEFKKTLTPDELAFFSDEDDDDDELALYDDEDKEQEKPKKKTVKASKTVELVKHPNGKAKNPKSTDTNKKIVKVVSSMEKDTKPRVKIEVLKSSSENVPESDSFDEYDDFDDADEKEDSPKKPVAEESQTKSQETSQEDKRNDNSKEDKKTEDDDEDDDDDDDDDYDYDEDETDEPVDSPESDKKGKGLQKEGSQEHPAKTAEPEDNSKKEENDDADDDEENEDASDHPSENDEDEEEDEDEHREDHKANPEKESSNEERVKTEISPFKTAEDEVTGKGLSEVEFEKLSKPIEVDILASDSKQTTLNISTSTQGHEKSNQSLVNATVSTTPPVILTADSSPTQTTNLSHNSLPSKLQEPETASVVSATEISNKSPVELSAHNKSSAKKADEKVTPAVVILFSSSNSVSKQTVADNAAPPITNPTSQQKVTHNASLPESTVVPVLPTLTVDQWIRVRRNEEDGQAREKQNHQTS